MTDSNKLDRIDYLIRLLMRIRGASYDNIFENILIDGISIQHPLFRSYLDGLIKDISYNKADGKLAVWNKSLKDSRRKIFNIK